MFNPFSGLEGTLNQNRGVPPYEYDVSEFAHTRKLNYIIPRMEVNLFSITLFLSGCQLLWNNFFKFIVGFQQQLGDAHGIGLKCHHSLFQRINFLC